MCISIKSVFTFFSMLFLFVTSCRKASDTSITVPVLLDHNRMLVDAEIRRVDGTWRQARLWIDSGNPTFFISESLAHDLGINLPGETERIRSTMEIPPPSGLRIGGFHLDLDDVPSTVTFQPYWLFSTMHTDGNLPSTLLKKHHVVFDYPKQEFTLAEPGSLRPRGKRAAAVVHPETGIAQIDALIDGDSLSFALDMGASYSFASDEIINRLKSRNPDWPVMTGAFGCANMWGWWPPNSETMPVLRIPVMTWGPIPLTGIGIVGVPRFGFGQGPTLGEWYSRKTVRPVDGFLGPNAFKAYRVEIDYADEVIYFKKGMAENIHELDMIGLSLRPEADGTYVILGIAEIDGTPAVEGVHSGDILVSIDEFTITGSTMGSVVDALRGTPGDKKLLMLERDGKSVVVKAEVHRFLDPQSD